MGALIGFATSTAGRYLLGGLSVLLLLGGVYVKGRFDGESLIRAETAEAAFKAQQKADALSNELIIAQASAMAVTEKKVVTYVDRIHTVQTPDTSCAADPRMRLGNVGVRDIVRGGSDPALGGAPASVQGPGAGTQP